MGALTLYHEYTNKLSFEIKCTFDHSTVSLLPRLYALSLMPGAYFQEVIITELLWIQITVKHLGVTQINLIQRHNSV